MSSKKQNKSTKPTKQSKQSPKQRDLNVDDIRSIYVRTGVEFKEPERTVLILFICLFCFN
jgi:hypothetical protein